MVTGPWPVHCLGPRWLQSSQIGLLTFSMDAVICRQAVTQAGKRLLVITNGISFSRFLFGNATTKTGLFGPCGAHNLPAEQWEIYNWRNRPNAESAKYTWQQHHQQQRKKTVSNYILSQNTNLKHADVNYIHVLYLKKKQTCVCSTHEFYFRTESHIRRQEECRVKAGKAVTVVLISAASSWIPPW